MVVFTVHNSDVSCLKTQKKQKKLNILSNLLHTKNHKWVPIENDIAKMGIADIAQHELKIVLTSKLKP
jgi:glycine cleavage system H lipoate-binding protein